MAKVKKKARTSFNVLGRRVKVKKVKGLATTAHMVGCYDFESKCIFVDSDIKDTELNTTIIHELVHAIWDRAGLNQTSISIDLQELICETISYVLDENGIDLSSK